MNETMLVMLLQLLLVVLLLAVVYSYSTPLSRVLPFQDN